jgi:hypothetical protein
MLGVARNEMELGAGAIRGAQLIVSVSAKGERMEYQCSLCGLIFRLADNRTAKEAMAVLWAAFKHHVRETHLEPPRSLEAR